MNFLPERSLLLRSTIIISLSTVAAFPVTGYAAANSHSLLRESRAVAGRVGTAIELAQRIAYGKDTVTVYLYRREYRSIEKYLPSNNASYGSSTDFRSELHLTGIRIEPRLQSQAAEDPRVVVSMQLVDVHGAMLPQTILVVPPGPVSKPLSVRFAEGDSTRPRSSSRGLLHVANGFLAVDRIAVRQITPESNAGAGDPAIAGLSSAAKVDVDRDNPQNELPAPASQTDGYSGPSTNSSRPNPSQGIGGTHNSSIAGDRLSANTESSQGNSPSSIPATIDPPPVTNFIPFPAPSGQPIQQTQASTSGNSAEIVSRWPKSKPGQIPVFVPFGFDKNQ